MNGFKKLLTTCITAIFLLTSSVSLAVDFGIVLPWLYEQGFTQYTTTQEFRPLDPITRGEASKFITQYAKIANIAKSYTACSFSDISNYDTTLTPFIADACAYGLLKGSQGKFMPNNNITEAEAITVIMRTMHGFQDETTQPWYQTYYTLGKTAGIINSETLESVEQNPISRAKLGEWLYLAAQLNPQKTTFQPIYQPPTQTSTPVNTNTIVQETTTNININTDTSSTQQHTVISQSGGAGGGINLSDYKPADADDSSDHIPGTYGEYNASSLEVALADNKKVALVFYSSACLTCNSLHQTITQNAGDIPPNMSIFRVDANQHSNLADIYNATAGTVVYVETLGEAKRNSTSINTLNDIIELAGSRRI